MSASRQFNRPIANASALASTHNSNTVANIFTTGGNVGIGTTSPSEKLHVIGNILSTGSIDAGTQFLGQALDSSTSPSFSWTGDTNTGIYRPLSDTLGFVTNGTEKIRVTTGGNVGINTTSPVGALDIRDSTNLVGDDGGALYITGGTNGNRRLHMGYHNTNNYGWIEVVEKGVDLRNLSLQPRNGNVGIGTTSPSGRLHVFDNSTGSSLMLTGLANNTSSNTGIFFSNDDQITLSRFKTKILAVGNGFWGISDLHFCLNNQSTAGDAQLSDTRMIITRSGLVGIGTTSPSSKLTIVGSETASNGENSAILIQNTAATSGNKWWLRTGAVGTTTPVGGLSIADNSAYRMVFASSGNIGIATTAPAYTLDVNGTLEASNTNGLILFASTGNVGIGTTSPGESLDVRGNLRVGGNTKGNYIAFYGTSGDTPGGWSHTFIGERIYAGTEQSELLLFKGNDASTGGGADRIRLLAAEHRFDTYTTNLSGTFEDVGATSVSNRMTITTAGNVGIGTATPSSTLDVVGSISKTVYNSGEVIQVKCYSSAIGTSFTTSISGAYPTNISSLSFTPKSTSSFISVHVDCTYSIGGSGPDTLQSGITIDGTTVITKTQIWYAINTDISQTMRNNNNSLFPLMGVRSNTTLTTKTINVVAGRVTSDDNINLSNINIIITEIQQ